jgi:ADP-heptose:LPS heptosyltransferase
MSQIKTVIVSHSGIGNLIHVTPCAKALVSMGHEVVICTWPRAIRILEGWSVAKVTIGHPYQCAADADNVIVSPAGAVWQDAWTSGRVFRSCPGKNWIKHESEYYMDHAVALGYRRDMPEPDAVVNLINYETATSFLRKHKLMMQPYICINASYLHSEHWHLKHWGTENYIGLLEDLSELGHRCVFVGTKEDYEEAQKIIDEVTVVNFKDYGHVNACGWSNDIKDTAALMTSATVVVGNDGGLQHVAAAQHTPTVTIFTFTNPIKNRPYGPNHRIVAVPCEKRISCQHGGVNQWERCKANGCFDASIDTVMEAMRKIL